MASSERWKKLKFVTSNSNKALEASQILGFTLEQVSSLVINEIQTYDIDAIIKHKAQQAYKELQSPVLVEDSSLVFTAWNGLPGALVKWFEISVGCVGLLKMLEGFDNREAFAISIVMIFDGREMYISRGEIKGVISEEVSGMNGFGWDTIFIPDGHFQTYAEMSFDEKNDISHRRQAFEGLRKYI